MTEVRRLEAPWVIEEGPSTFTVRTSNGLVVSVTYFDDEPKRGFNLRREEARRVAVAIARLPDLIALEKSLTEFGSEAAEDDGDD